MFSRLITTLASTFYKTKWTHPIARAHPDKPLQVPIKHWKIFTGDTVKVRSGSDKNKVGKVVKVFRKTNQLVVKGVNKHQFTKSMPSTIQNIKTERQRGTGRANLFMSLMLDCSTAPSIKP
jgi:hypothetical protein